MSLNIIKAGLLDTVQDGGRYGYQFQGINPNGAMDRFAASLANALLGNSLQAPIIEMHFPAATFRFLKPAIICLTGADFRARINDQEISINQPVAIPSNALLTFQQKQQGARCYMAILNGLQLTPWLNSFSTNLKAGAGGYKGRRLQTGDSLHFSDIEFSIGDTAVSLPWQYHRTETTSCKIEFLPGPEWHWLTSESQALFCSHPFVISPASDRMGYRLQGETLEQKVQEQLVSSAVCFGTVQLLPNGSLIVLMADHQTTGGYPRVASVISVHLPKLAQMDAGKKVKFRMTTLAAAEEKVVAQQNYLHHLQNTCKLKMENWVNAHRY